LKRDLKNLFYLAYQRAIWFFENKIVLEIVLEREVKKDVGSQESYI